MWNGFFRGLVVLFVFSTGVNQSLPQVASSPKSSVLASLNGPDDIAYFFSTVSWSPDGKILVIGNRYGLYFYRNYQLVSHPLVVSSLGVTQIVFSPDGKLIAALLINQPNSRDPANKVWVGKIMGDTIQPLWETRVIFEWSYSGLTRGMTFDPKGKVLAVYNYYSIVFYEPLTGTRLTTHGAITGYDGNATMARGLGDVYSLRFSPHGQYLAAAGVQVSHDLTPYDFTVIVLFDLNAETAKVFYRSKTFDVTNLVFSNDGSKLIFSTVQGIKVWSVYADSEMRTLANSTSIPYSMTSSSDGKWLAGGLYEGQIRLWNMASGQIERQFDTHAGRVASLTFSPDASVLVWIGTNETAGLWDLRTDRHWLLMMPTVLAF